jgi:hypothetical protein
LVTHDAHVPVAVSQTGVEPVHCVLFVPEHTPHAPLGSHAGVPPWQSVSPVQGRHVPVAVLQTGFVPLHAEAFVAEHWPQAPEDSHAGVLPPQSTSPAQARHVCVAPLQTGVVPLQSAFAVQRTHTPAVASHTGVPPVHFVALPAEHWPHAPDGSQAGVAPPHSPSPPQARHVCVAPLQMGVVPLQSAFAVQRTHTPAVVSHTGVPPVHFVVLPAEHWPHAPDGSHAGVVPPHSPSPPQARQVRNAGSQMGVEPAQSPFARQPTHVFVVVLQIGVAPPHVVLPTHSTHVAAPTSHAGVAPPQWVVFDAEHSPHAPLARHTGVVAGQSLLAAHGLQVFVASQTGVIPEQFALDRQLTQTLGEAVVRQYGWAPLQSEFCAHPSTVTTVGGAAVPPLPLPFER